MTDTKDRYAPFIWVRGAIDIIDSEDLLKCLSVWQDFKSDNEIPNWNVEILAALPPHILPFANVVDLGNGIPPFAYRFFGTGLASMHTFELTGNTTEEIEPLGFRNVCIDQSLMTRDKGEPTVFLNSIPTKVEGIFSRQTTLRLPLSDDTGAVRYILTVEETSEDPKKMWERFARCHPTPPSADIMG